VYRNLIPVFVLVGTNALFAQITFTKIVDTNTLIPSGTGGFTQLDIPSIDGNHVAFLGVGANDQRGIYADNGGLHMEVNTTTAIPGETENFTTFGRPVFDNGDLGFLGFGPSGHEGVYLKSGQLAATADTSTDVPGGSGKFADFGTSVTGISLSGSQVAFRGLGLNGERGIYSHSDSLNIVADTNSLLPDQQSTFASFGSVATSGGDTAFVGTDSNGVNGIYLETGSLSTIVDESTVAPGGKGNFDAFGNFVFQGNHIAFSAVDGLGNNGVYSIIDGNLRTVIDEDVLLPGTTNFFGGIGGISLDGDIIAFMAVDSMGVDGLFAEVGSSLINIAKEGDLLDGELLSTVSFGLDGIDGSRLAFLAGFESGEQAIYVVTIPEPTTVSLLALGGLAFLRRKRR